MHIAPHANGRRPARKGPSRSSTTTVASSHGLGRILLDKIDEKNIIAKTTFSGFRLEQSIEEIHQRIEEGRGGSANEDSRLHSTSKRCVRQGSRLFSEIRNARAHRQRAPVIRARDCCLFLCPWSGQSQCARRIGTCEASRSCQGLTTASGSISGEPRRSSGFAHTAPWRTGLRRTSGIRVGKNLLGLSSDSTVG